MQSLNTGDNVQNFTRKLSSTILGINYYHDEPCYKTERDNWDKFQQQKQIAQNMTIHDCIAGW